MRVRPVKSGGFSPFLVLRPSRLRHRAGGTPAPRSGYTLVEILIATTLALMLMAAVARMFGQLGTSVSNSRATLETLERLRETAVRMQMDLDGVTVTMLPPRPVANGEGYLEYIEGSYNAAQPVNNLTGGSDSSMTLSTSLGAEPDRHGRPAGRHSHVHHAEQQPAVQRPAQRQPRSSRRRPRWPGSSAGTCFTAACCWSRRGRRFPSRASTSTFYASNDISVHVSPQPPGLLVPNTLADLTRRECRFAHGTTWPYDARVWGQLGLPTTCECAVLPWSSCNAPAVTVPSLTQVDLWSVFSKGNTLWLEGNYLATSNTSNRVSDNVILTNVIGFDVKAWDPTVQAYVDLGYNNTGFTAANATGFGHLGAGTPKSQLYANAHSTWAGGPQTECVYDTFSTSYERTQSPGGGSPGQVANGFDNDGNGVVGDINYTDPTKGDNQTAPPTRRRYGGFR